VVAIDLFRKIQQSADYMVIASGRSSRQLGAPWPRHLQVKLQGPPASTGWVFEGRQGQAIGFLIDGGDIIIHLFRPDVRHLLHLGEDVGHGTAGTGARRSPRGLKPNPRTSFFSGVSPRGERFAVRSFSFGPQGQGSEQAPLQCRAGPSRPR